MTPPFKRGDRQVWHGRPYANPKLSAYARGWPRKVLYGGIILTALAAWMIVPNLHELEGAGWWAFALFLAMGPFLLGLALFLFYAITGRKRRLSTRYGVTATRAIIGSVNGEGLRYTIQPDDPIEVFQMGDRWGVRFNDGRVKRVWEDNPGTTASRRSYLQRMHPDGFGGLTREEAYEAEAALLAARDAAQLRAA